MQIPANLLVFLSSLACLSTALSETPFPTRGDMVSSAREMYNVLRDAESCRGPKSIYEKTKEYENRLKICQEDLAQAELEAAPAAAFVIDPLWQGPCASVGPDYCYDIFGSLNIDYDADKEELAIAIDFETLGDKKVLEKTSCHMSSGCQSDYIHVANAEMIGLTKTVTLSIDPVRAEELTKFIVHREFGGIERKIFILDRKRVGLRLEGRPIAPYYDLRLYMDEGDIISGYVYVVEIDKFYGFDEQSGEILFEISK